MRGSGNVLVTGGGEEWKCGDDLSAESSSERLLTQSPARRRTQLDRFFVSWSNAEFGKTLALRWLWHIGSIFYFDMFEPIITTTSHTCERIAVPDCPAKVVCMTQPA